MKVCDLTQSYAPTGGGIRTYIHAKRDYIREHTGHEHLLVVPGADDRVIRDGRATTYTIASPRVPGSQTYRLLLRSDKVLRILGRERPQVVEALCAYNLPWTALHYRKRRPGTVVVAGYRTDFPRAYAEPIFARVGGAGLGRRARAVGYRYARALYNRCDLVYALSPLLRAQLEEVGVKDVQLLPLGVDLEVFSPEWRDPALRRTLGVGDGELLLVYAGRLDGEKRVAVVADAFERLNLPSAHLVLAGEGPLRPALERRAARNGRIRVLPFQSERADLARLLASADVYVSAMPFETFGLSVVEAQACGLPVVGVRAGAMPDRVPPGTGLLAAPDDPADLARQITVLLAGNPAVVGRAARTLVEERFSWRATFDRLFGWYGELLADR